MKKPSWIIFFFLVILCAITGTTVMAYWDRQTISEKENRKLEQLPVLTAQSWFSGDFARTVEDFLSDHAYNREELLTWSELLEAGMEKKMDAKIVTQTADLGQDNGITASGEKTPADTAEQGTGAGEAEEEAEEEERIILSDRILISYQSNEIARESYIEVVNSFFDMFPGNISKTLMLVPGRIAFEPDWQDYSRNQKEDIQEVYSRMELSVNVVDIWEKLAQEEVNDIYFRTDHHWTADGAYIGVKSYLEAIGRECIAREVYNRQEGENYLGYLYAQTKTEGLKEHPDTLIYYLHPDGVNKEAVYKEDEENPEGCVREEGLVIDPQRHGYYTFVENNFRYAVVDGRAEDGSCLLLVGDSYCNSMAPWLSDNFGKVIIVDPREWVGGKKALTELYQGEGVTDVLITDYSPILNNKWFIGKLKELTE